MVGTIPAMTLFDVDVPAADAPDGEAFRFTVYGQAKPGGSKKAIPHPRTGRPMIVEDSKNKPWRQEVAGAALEALAGVTRPLFADEALAVEFTFVRPRPLGHYGASGSVRSSAPAHPVTRPDVLKLARAAEDALNGIVWRDDSQIVHETLVKVYGEPERLEVAVRRRT
jgi:Holliday junction resolvase RusA-like endonuclease